MTTDSDRMERARSIFAPMKGLEVWDIQVRWADGRDFADVLHASPGAAAAWLYEAIADGAMRLEVTRRGREGLKP